MKIQGIDHVEFCVGDTASAAARLCEDFGFAVHGRGGPGTGLPGEEVLLLRQGHESPSVKESGELIPDGEIFKFGLMFYSFRNIREGG